MAPSIPPSSEASHPRSLLSSPNIPVKKRKLQYTIWSMLTLPCFSFSLTVISMAVQSLTCLFTIFKFEFQWTVKKVKFSKLLRELTNSLLFENQLYQFDKIKDKLGLNYWDFILTSYVTSTYSPSEIQKPTLYRAW